MLGKIGAGGRFVYTIPSIDMTEFNRIGAIITRVDPHEQADAVGEYTVRLTAG